jgi:hypothetical protein
MLLKLVDDRQGAVVVHVGVWKRKKIGWKCGRHFIARPNLISGKSKK